MRVSILFLLFVSVVSFADSVEFPGVFSFPQGARNAAEQVWKQLRTCGVETLDPFDPRLPRPQVPATAALARRGENGLYQLLGYYYEDGICSYVFKAPNGGWVHRIRFGQDAIQFVTPLQGNIAWASDYYTPAGRFYNFWVKGQAIRVGYDYWHQFVQTYFVDYLTSQFCGPVGAGFNSSGNSYEPSGY
jgi:hypothetical protein